MPEPTVPGGASASLPDDVRALLPEARQAADAVQDRHEFLEQALDAAVIGWWISGPDRGRLAWSPAAHRIFGLSPAEFDGRTESMLRLVHPDDSPRVSEAIAAALEGRTPVQVEHRIIQPGGRVRWVHQSVVAARHAEGAAIRLLGACQDITDRKQAEDENRAAAAYNRSLIEASLDPLVTIGQDGAIADVNVATELATGCSRDELIGTEFSDYFSRPDRARAGYQHAFRDGTIRDYPLDLRHRDGRTTPVLYNASVYRDPAGQVLGIFAAARDITQIRHAQQALRDSEQRLHAIFDTAPVGIYDMSLNSEFVSVNPQFCRLVGRTADELLSLRMQDIIHPDDAPADLAQTKRLLAGEIEAYSIEKRLLRTDGAVVWAEVNRAAVRDQTGAPLLLVGVARDLTAQRRAEAEVASLTSELEARVEQRTAELERANRNLEAFTYSVSHDLRAPLRALSGFAEALVEDYGDRLDVGGRDYIRRIDAASQRMATLLEDLLHLSRVSRAEIKIEEVDLSAQVAAIAAELRSHEPDREVTISIQPGIRATADPNLIRTVLQNLIENAWKFTGRRTDASIEFGSMPTVGTAVCCFVRDNGAGFDPAYAGKLFQPFQRLHPASEFPGTGIGLASVRQIVERHGGRAWAESTPGGGATFYFTLSPGPAASGTASGRDTADTGDGHA